MYEKFFEELNDALLHYHIKDAQSVIAEYQKKYENLLACGKSEFESIVALGDPQIIASNIAGINYTDEEKLQRLLSEDGSLLQPKPAVNEVKTQVENFEKIKDGNTKKTEKPPTKLGIILTDILYYLPSMILSLFSIIAIGFIGALCGVMGVRYAIFAWIDFSVLSEQINVFILALMGIAIFIGALILTIMLIKTVFRGNKRYFLERKERWAKA